MPPPFSSNGRIQASSIRSSAGACSSVRLRRREQAATVQQRDEVSPVFRLANGFGHQQRDGVEFHLGTEFLESARADAIGGHFLISDDSAGNVPPGSKIWVVSPREQGAAGVIPVLVAIFLDQEIDVDHRQDAAGEEENRLREPLVRVADHRFESADRTKRVHRRLHCSQGTKWTVCTSTRHPPPVG